MSKLELKLWVVLKLVKSFAELRFDLVTKLRLLRSKVNLSRISPEAMLIYGRYHF